jgi:hypothetical protein
VDPNDEILALFMHRLSALTYDGVSYPIYTVVPQNTAFNYVLMAPVEFVDDSAKGINSYECTQLFDVVTLDKGRNSWKACNSLCGQIMDEIMKLDLVTQNWHSTVEPVVDGSNAFMESVEGGVILRKLIRFRYNLQQT